ncbi:MAG: hypothetical protein ABR608_01150 [Pseudonocardiaceae bacterium]
MSDSTVQIGAWVAFGAESEIAYQIFPGTDRIEFTLGGRHGLDLEMTEAGLRRCISAFAGALNELTGAAIPDAERLPEARPADVTETCDLVRPGGEPG